MALLPHSDPHLAEAIASAGGTLADLADLAEARALVWIGNVDGFPDPLPDTIEWVQLRLAGIDGEITHFQVTVKVGFEPADWPARTGRRRVVRVPFFPGIKRNRHARRRQRRVRPAYSTDRKRS